MSNLKEPYNPLLESARVDDLLEEIRIIVVQAQKKASLATRAEKFSPIADAGQHIRAERKRQNLTLNDLCELSGVAYATLSKIEQGHPSARLDSLESVTSALGMGLWIG